MDENKPEVGGAQVPPKEEETIAVKPSVLADITERLAKAEQTAADAEARAAGVEEMLASGKGADPFGEKKLREKKSFEPKFRTVRLRKFPIAGDITNLGYVVGWTKRGAYQEVDKTGVTPQYVNYIDIIFLGHEKTVDGKLQAEKVRLLDLLERGEQVSLKILKTVRDEDVHETGEEIHVTMYDPQHGLVDTGETVDGFYTTSKITYTVDVPGHGPVEIDGDFVN